MPQGIDQTYESPLVPTANNMPRPHWNQGNIDVAQALGGVRPQPQIPPGGGGTNIQALASRMPQGNAIANMAGGLNQPQVQLAQAPGFTGMGNFVQGRNAGTIQANPATGMTTQIDPATGQPIPQPGMQPHTRADVMPSAGDVMNTIQPTGQPQPAPGLPQEVQGMMDNIMGYFSQNPEAANAVFGQGGLQNFQAKLSSLFQPVSAQLPNYANSLAGQVAGRGGSVIQGLKNLFTNKA